ncbi:hypothetical protein D9Q98_000612 [Chlorella vulgaris]|uniref:Uncharacterized protein n=1 Tax=Chlorella vulgaris TaxID=3077 RepID=A0A9D4Z1T6_CHLVU|nr:hypothetical protein D9Q98_000612 [Chlorella vulgaris]
MFVALRCTGAPLVSSSSSSREVTTCATHPQFKGAKKMAHRRPKKRNPSDRRHGPAQYPEQPAPPAEYVVVSQ